MLRRRVPVDNELYDRLSETWWNDDSVLSLLRTSINPARFGYMRRVLVDELGIGPQGKTALDIGSGGGLLAEEFARACARRRRGTRHRLHRRSRRGTAVPRRLLRHRLLL
jgi:hypothetical protein